MSMKIRSEKSSTSTDHPSDSRNASHTENSDKPQGSKSYPWTARRIVALAAIILLVGMYVATLVAALLSSPGAGDLFRFCLGMTIAVPIFAWIILWAIGKFRGRDNF